MLLTLKCYGWLYTHSTASYFYSDAQKHPENYRNLIVRVAGFSAYFVELAKSIQDEVIQRTEHTMGVGQSGTHVHTEPHSLPPARNYTPDSSFKGDTKGVIFNIEDYTIQDGPGNRTTIFLKGCPLSCQVINIFNYF